MSGEKSAPTGPSACPICGAPTDPRLRPFCSKRCKDVDLNRWLKGVYAIAAVEADEAAEPGGEERD